MTKLSLEEILSIPELSFYLEPQEFNNFIFKRKDFEKVANLYNSDKPFAFSMSMFDSDFEEEQKTEGNNDSRVTRNLGNIMKRNILENQKLIGKDSFILFLGGLAAKYLRESYTSKEIEITYTNGDIIIARDGQAIKKGIDDLDFKYVDISEVRGKLVEGILIASKELQDNIKRKSNMSFVGTYMGRGTRQKMEKIKFSLKELDELHRSKIIYESLSVDKIKELINKKLLKSSDVLRSASAGYINSIDVLVLLKEGVLKKEEVLKKVFKANSFNEVLKKKDFSSEMKFALYSIGEVNIKELEKSFENFDTTISPDVYLKMKKYFDHKKIGELLTHNVLSFTESRKFLKVLEENRSISHDENLYFQKVMEDFKCDELLNQVETEEIDKKEGEVHGISHEPRLTIDPILRTEYLKSIGAIKRVKINGEMAISEDEKNKRKTNSLDGYELFVIPDKKIAVLEKRYEVTRNKDGHIVYKTNKKGEYIPALDNATYIMPIGLARDLVESKNKKDLIASPYVYRTFHTMDWVRATQSRMKAINPEIEFHKDNTEVWKEKIAKDYKQRKEKRDEYR